MSIYFALSHVLTLMQAIHTFNFHNLTRNILLEICKEMDWFWQIYEEKIFYYIFYPILYIFYIRSTHTHKRLAPERSMFESMKTQSKYIGKFRISYLVSFPFFLDEYTCAICVKKCQSKLFCDFCIFCIFILCHFKHLLFKHSTHEQI